MLTRASRPKFNDIEPTSIQIWGGGITMCHNSEILLTYCIVFSFWQHTSEIITTYNVGYMIGLPEISVGFNSGLLRPVVYWATSSATNSFKLMWRCHQFLSGFLTEDHRPRVSRQSRLSANDNYDNEMISGTVNRSLGIYLKLRKTPDNLR